MCAGMVLALTAVLAQHPDPASFPRPAAPTPTPPPAPAATGAPAEHLSSFDADRAFAAWSFQGWKVNADDATIKDFGRSESDARLALRLIRELRLNQHGVIGGPVPSLEYWLSDGKPPQGPARGLRVLPIDAASVRVEKVQDQWVMRDDHRVLFTFGRSQADAQLALNVVRKYGFTEVGTIGAGAPSMTILLAQPNPVSSVPAASPAPPAASPPAQPAAPGLDGLPTPAVLPLRGSPVPSSPIYETTATPERVPFDWRRVQLQQENGAWRLAAGSLVLADFGTDEHAARLGLAAMEYYQFTERRQAGGFTYFLSAGQAPRRVMFGMDAQLIQPDRLEVRPVDGGWAVCAGDEPLVRTGDQPEDANAVLDVIQRLRCDRLCRLGTGDGKGMTLLIRSR